MLIAGGIFMSEKPNDTARLQFLAVLEYLLTKTDEEHLSRTSDIQKYAVEQYGVTLRREQVKSIVEHIYELSKTRKKVLPYEIRCSCKTGINRKYYVAKKKFDTNAIVKICSAILNEKTVSNSDATYLVDQLVNDYVVTNKQKEVKKRISQRNRNVKKMDPALSRQTDLIYDLELSHNVFKFSLKATSDDVFEQSGYSYTPDIIKIEPQVDYNGVVIKVEEEKKSKHLYVFIYLQELKAVIKTSIDNVINIEDWGIPYRNGNTNLLDEEAQLGRIYRERIDHRTGEHLSPYTTVQRVMERKWGKNPILYETVTFKFCINRKDKLDKALFNRTKESFEKFFECPMQSERKERECIFDKGTDYERTVTAVDVYVTVNTDFHTFKKWVTEEALLLDNIVVMTPELRNWNDRLLEGLIERYANRLNKYGYRYQYVVSKTLTEQAQKDQEEYEKEIAEWRAKRKAILAKATNNNQGSEQK